MGGRHMPSPSLVIVVAFALLASACGVNAAGPPAITVDHTPCSHCGMLISEPAFAAAYRVDGQEARVFDDIGCLLNALRTGPAAPAIWVQDAAGAGWIDASDATYVTSSRIPTPMNGGVLAYASADAAAQTAHAQGGELVRSFAELATRKGEGR